MAELWDDTALITAFNSAIAKYKAMHGVAGNGNGNEVAEGGLPHSDTREECPKGLEAEHMNPLEKEEKSHESSLQENETPLLKDENLSSHGEERVENETVEEAPATAGYDVYTGSDYNAHHSHQATAEDCYMCQWNAYYNQSGAWAPPASFGPNGLQCQYCGFVNHCGDGANSQQQTPNVVQSAPDASTFPEIVRAAVAEAVKAADGQKSREDMAEASRADTGFADVAVAWFLAGFHTSRYLSQGMQPK